MNDISWLVESNPWRIIIETKEPIEIGIPNEFLDLLPVFPEIHRYNELEKS